MGKPWDKLKNRYVSAASRRKYVHSLKIVAKDRKALAGFSILLMYALTATIGPVIVPLDRMPHIEETFLPPSWEHLLGTDFAGRDTLSHIVHGSTSVLLTAVLTAIISVSVAITIGLVAGYIGGVVDIFLMGAANVILTIPSFPLILVLAITLGSMMEQPLLLASVLSITAWAGLARSVRSQVLSIKESEFVDACRILGLGKTHIIFQEILPNITPYVAINALFATVGAIYSQVGLYFIGALPFTSANWGVMLNIAGERGAFWGVKTIYYYFAPIIAICLLDAGIILSISGIEKILNPRLREE